MEVCAECGYYPPRIESEELCIKCATRRQYNSEIENFNRVLTCRVEQYYAPNKLGRNDPCLCGSGKKYKRCCL